MATTHPLEEGRPPDKEAPKPPRTHSWSHPSSSSSSSALRNSYHRDADEALSSLLWQPYEYQHGLDSSAAATNKALSCLPPFDQSALCCVSRDCTLSTRPSRPSLSSVASEAEADGTIGDAERKMQPQSDQLAEVNHRHDHARSASVPHYHPDHGVVNHLRSASVPKSEVCQVRADQVCQSAVGGSTVSVNSYRAVSSVPSIQCLNTRNEGNSVSNVQIMPLGTIFGVSGTTQVTVHTPPRTVPQSRGRTFTSTEAQTDEISVVPRQETPPRRPREKREKRHRRNHRSVDSGTQAGGDATQGGRVPDLLDNHMPPPYSQITGVVTQQPPPPVPILTAAPVLQNVPSLMAFPAPQVPLVQNGVHTGFRFQFPSPGFRRGRFSEEPPKGCCGLLTWKPGSLRWFIAVIALIAVCCVLVGTALGAMRPAGRDHLTVSLLMIGVGIVLVTVSGVAWRLTSHDSVTCRSMLGLGSSSDSLEVCRRFVPRLPPSYGRPHHPYAAMMYPEFQYRPPPPSYQASMQEYRLRLLLLDRGGSNPQVGNGVQSTVSPPPTYRSHAGSLLRAPLSSRRDPSQSEYSCPPSYRSQNSTNNRPQTIQPSIHSREQSLSDSGGEVNVVNILAAAEDDVITLDSLKLEPDHDLNPVKLLLKGTDSELGGKEGNLVTIVQTSDHSPVIVTVSGSSAMEGTAEMMSTEMEILAHL